MSRTKELALAVVAITMWWSAPGATQQNGHELLQKALTAERALGDLQQAVALYEQIVRDYEATDRTLVAWALVQLGVCYERLGREEAEARYQRVLREFADQTEPAGVAARRLAAFDTADRTGPLTLRRLLATSDDLSGAYLSPDTRFLASPDDLSDGPAIRDLRTNRVARLTTRGASKGAAITTLLSPDLRHVVYSWRGVTHYELRLMRNEPGANVQILLSSESRESYFVPKVW